jgi:hypothetical protein
MTYHSTLSRSPIRWRVYPCLLILFSVSAGAAIPAPERILPDDTLVMVSVPDYAKLREITRQLPLGQLWNDPAMKPFR